MKLRGFLFLLGGLLVAINIVSAAWGILEYRVAVVRDASRGFNNLTAALAEQTARSLESVGLVVHGAAREISENRDGNLAARKRRFEDRTSGIPQIRSLFQLDRAGRVVVSNFPGSIPGTDFSDRAYFTKFRDGLVKGRYVSEPFLGRLTNKWAFAVTEPLTDAGGNFTGVVGAIIDIEYVNRLYRSLDFGTDESVALVTRDGVLITRVPPREEWFGKHVAAEGSPLAELIRGGRFSGWVSGPIDGGARMLASMAPVPGSSLIVGAGASEDAVLAPWRAEAGRVAAQTLFVSVAVLGLVWFAARALARREQADQRAREGKRLAQAEQERLEKRLHQAEKLEAVGRLAGGIAHDFNGILGGILGYGGILLETLARGSRERYYVSNLVMAANRGRDLVAQILTYSRAEKVPRIPIEFDAVVREALDVVRALLPERMTLQVAIAADPLVVVADSTQLHQVVMNLCTNAIQAMGETGELRLSLQAVDLERETSFTQATLPAGAYAKLAVTDTGVGMDEATLARIFEPFFTTKEVGKGTGLGLCMVYGIVAATGGATHVDSEPGRGSRFEVYLPRLALDRLDVGAGKAGQPAHVDDVHAPVGDPHDPARLERA